MSVLPPPSLSSQAIIGLTFITYQASMKGAEEISCHTVWFSEEWVGKARPDWRGERERHLTIKGASGYGIKSYALSPTSWITILLWLLYHPPSCCCSFSTSPVSQRARRTSPITHRHSLTPALPRLYLISSSRATASCLLVLQATLLITYSLSVSVHLCLWSKSQLMEWGKVKHSNNGDSCFSLFEKIHFVLLSALSSNPPNSPPRPQSALNSSPRLLLPGLIRGSEKQAGEGREGDWHNGKSAGHNELHVEKCGRNLSPARPWASSTPEWFNTEIKMGRGVVAMGRQSGQASLLASVSFVVKGGSSVRSNTGLSGRNLRIVADDSSCNQFHQRLIVLQLYVISFMLTLPLAPWLATHWAVGYMGVFIHHFKCLMCTLMPYQRKSADLIPTSVSN